MNLYLTCLFLLFVSLNSRAQGTDTLVLWPNEVPGETEARHPPVQTANTSGNVTRITDITDPAMVVFKPKGAGNGAGIIVCPGGGYNILAIDKEGYEVATWLNELGFTAFVLQYRVPDKREQALYDLQRAIRLIRSSADYWEVDPARLGLIGFSAGGSLAARASTQFDRQSYPIQDQIDSLSARPDFALLIYPAYLDEGDSRSLTPELVLKTDTPPQFLFGTADDRYGNSALVMAAALRDKKIPVTLHFLAEGGHGYGMRKGNVAAETWPGLAEKWFQQLILKDNRPLLPR
ncbi:Acetyl esterase/lipase [Cyclobacterium lianum]|uniref:Acetyl esterase/lipase n=1 Tax=Cyclobacterium lianum TaxID=388280 RepID=A0A1M7Q6I8_9BACT|nr:alpha/beta hydrolase [Cyclobacterium lianum]SHN26101.1 Acetyl esterase/lipase [Cyclobacterium lianum]